MSGRALNGARMLILGIAYKKNVDDTRESPAFKIMELLEQRGAARAFPRPVSRRDPADPRARRNSPAAARSPLSAAMLAEIDAAIICTDHDDVDYALLVEHCPLVVDTRNACAQRGLTGVHIVKA